MAQETEALGHMDKLKEFFHKLKKKMSLKKKSGGQGSIPAKGAGASAPAAASQAAIDPAANAGALQQGSIPPAAAAAAPAVAPGATAAPAVAVAPVVGAQAPAPVAASGAAPVAAAPAPAPAPALPIFDIANNDLKLPVNNDADHTKSEPSISQDPPIQGVERMEGTFELLEGLIREDKVPQSANDGFTNLYNNVKQYNEVMNGKSIAYGTCRSLLTKIQLQARVLAGIKEASAELKTVAESISEARVPGELAYIAPKILGMELKTQPEPNAVNGTMARHLMSFRIRVKYPELPICYNDGTIGGVHFGYWEEIFMKYQFKRVSSDQLTMAKSDIKENRGSFIKGWNNIGAIVPGTATFNPTEEHKDHLEQQYDTERMNMTGLSKMIAEGQAGQLQGERELVFLDRPGMNIMKFEPNTKQMRTYADRTLNFRIEVHNDAGQRKEMFCSQSMVISNSIPISLLMNHGASAAGVSTSGSEDMEEGGAVASFMWQRHIPKVAIEELSGFVQSAMNGTAQPFDQAEYNGARVAFGKEAVKPGDIITDGNDNDIWDGNDAPYAVVVKAGGAGAGAHGLARPQNGDLSYQMPIGNEGRLLVAIINAGRLMRLYYCNGKSNEVSGRTSPEIGKTYKLGMRGFLEVPVEAYYDNTMQKAVAQQQEPQQLAAPVAVQPVAPAQPKNASEKLGYLQISVDNLELNNKKFRKDAEYQEIGSLAQSYNGSLNGPAEAAAEIRRKLTVAAAAYLHKHSFAGDGKKKIVQNATQQEKITVMIMQLTMTSGAQAKAVANLDEALDQHMQTASSENDAQIKKHSCGNVKSFFTRAIKGDKLPVASDGGSNREDFVASPALRALAISTFSLLEMQEQADGFRRNVATMDSATSSATFDKQGRRGAEFGFNSFTDSNLQSTEKEEFAPIGSLMHEATHTVDDNVYQNAFAFGIEADATKEEMRKESEYRMKNLMDLKVNHDNSDKKMGVDSEFLNETDSRIDYAGITDKQRITYNYSIMKKWKSKMMNPFASKKQIAAQNADYNQMDLIRTMGLKEDGTEDTDFNLTVFNEYDAVMPQLLVFMESKGIDKSNPIFYRKVRSMALDSMVKRMNANDANKLKS